MRTTIFKAQANPDRVIPDLEISATEPIPTIESFSESFYRPALTGVFTSDAEKLVNALEDSLPGGTIDQVLALLLQRKASIYVVRQPKHFPSLLTAENGHRSDITFADEAVGIGGSK